MSIVKVISDTMLRLQKVLDNYLGVTLYGG